MQCRLGLGLLLGSLAGCAGISPATDPPPPPPVPAAAGYYQLDTVWLGQRPAGAARAAAGFEPVLRWVATAPTSADFPATRSATATAAAAPTLGPLPER